MSVLIETSKGDLVFDLLVDDCPKACTNFLKLCKVKYYNNCLFYNVQRGFIVQSGDPTNTGRGGESVWGLLYGDQARFFEDEIRPHLRHTKRGLLCMAGAVEGANTSQFYITAGEGLVSLDEKHTIFGELAEGLEVLEAISETPVDADGRPLQNIRIRHTIPLEDPFPDPPGLEQHIPDASPPPQYADDGRLEDDWVPDADARPPEEIEQANREREAQQRAVVLEMIGDLPEAEAKPPSNMLFVCKLNPATREEDLEVIFSRFGTITSCDVIRDWKTGESLNYAFIGFDNDDACEQAYFKMNNVLIDDRRIKVDFSQSVHHLWKQFRRFGGRGNAELQQEADAHLRQQQGNQGRPRLELKDKFRGPAAAGGQRGAGSYQLLLEEEEERPAKGVPAQEAPRQRDARGGDERRGGQERRREEQQHRSGSRQHRRERSRSRSRERRRGRSRSRSRDKRRRGRSRSRSRDQQRRRHSSRDRQRQR